MHSLLSSLVVLCIFAQPLSAQDAPPLSMNMGNCSYPQNQDKYSLRPDPDNQGGYILYYQNGIANCSDSLNDVGVTNGDFRIRLNVVIDYEGSKELIWAIPEDPQYMAYPPELILEDSNEDGIIRFIPGIS
ncbi:hypothetical protein [Sulfitobacter phage vB_SupP_AX]|nr:hypothetical protein [Sulfitobacter phage vB_SupP_AX]